MSDELRIFLTSILPSVVVAIGVWWFQRTIVKLENRRTKLDECREQHQVIMLKSINASIALGEATAKALRDGHTNGEVTQALSYSNQVKHEQRDFYQQQGIQKII